MFETIVFSIVLIIALWPYFISLEVMNFKKDPNAMETPLPGRPARRTVARKNEDVSKAIAYIFLGYGLIVMGLYAFLNFKDLLPTSMLVIIGCAAFFVSFFLFSPANRLSHAYIDLGHLAVVHLVCGFSVFNIVSSLIYGYALTPFDMGVIATMVFGAMLTFSRYPDVEVRRQKELKDAQKGGF